MFRRHHAISVQQATQESPLAHLAALAQESQNRLKALDSLIPAGLRTCIQAGPIDGTSWCLLVSGNAAATRMRQLTPRLAGPSAQQGVACGLDPPQNPHKPVPLTAPTGCRR